MSSIARASTAYAEKHQGGSPSTQDIMFIHCNLLTVMYCICRTKYRISLKCSTSNLPEYNSNCPQNLIKLKPNKRSLQQSRDSSSESQMY
ncbi:hypothetical protein AQUCO_00900573v1 [Aquilegia coerulea]|uniref:Uncharacterized protein n=1 Tax=Aquilegia coerulea TaxID=218851 RepID=A0A2G5EE94_AQUCA|nr:hypothetical protein AQUCO_00900573v1 [Aquilegia coerulea]